MKKVAGLVQYSCMYIFVTLQDSRNFKNIVCGTYNFLGKPRKIDVHILHLVVFDFIKSIVLVYIFYENVQKI